MNQEEQEKLKNTMEAINPKIPIVFLLSNDPKETKQTKFGIAPVGSTNSYQLMHTEANFSVYRHP